MFPVLDHPVRASAVRAASPGLSDWGFVFCQLPAVVEKLKAHSESALRRAVGSKAPELANNALRKGASWSARFWPTSWLESARGGLIP